MTDEIQIQRHGDKFIAIWRGIYVAVERTESLARACAEARVKAGLLDDSSAS